MSDPTTPDDRRRAAEWLRARAKRVSADARRLSLWASAEAERLFRTAEAFDQAADAYEKGEQP